MKIFARLQRAPAASVYSPCSTPYKRAVARFHSSSSEKHQLQEGKLGIEVRGQCRPHRRREQQTASASGQRRCMGTPIVLALLGEGAQRYEGPLHTFVPAVQAQQLPLPQLGTRLLWQLRGVHGLISNSASNDYTTAAEASSKGRRLTRDAALPV